jgi:hypothetical protein
VLFEKRKRLPPSIYSLSLTIIGPMVIKEAVSGIGVHVKLVGFAMFLELGLVLGDLFWGRAAVILTK